MSVAEPPKLYGPHAPIIALKTSDNYACVPQNLKKSVGCPRETRIIHDLSSRITFRGITGLQQFI
jgi:hypothetical protein